MIKKKLLFLFLKKDVGIQWAYTKTEGNKKYTENYSGKSCGGTVT